MSRDEGMLSRLFRWRTRAIDFAPPAPETPVEIVGDIHGRADLLRLLPPAAPGAVRVYVGDYVDRGPDSRSVLEFIHAESARPDRVCLMGNHEEMLLRFLRDPAGTPSWLRFGGLQTLASFGVSGVTHSADDAALQRAAAAMRAALPFDLTDWLDGLPNVWTSGTLAVAHAGLDPARAVHAQAARAMLWGAAEFPATPRTDGLWVAHGHTIVEEPGARAGVISVDTGAYATNRLTMACIGIDGEVVFRRAGDPEYGKHQPG